jgi:type I restriction enzyme R subunit
MTSIHTEATFEAEIEAHLLAHGYQSLAPNTFDRQAALFPQAVLAFIEASQPKVWEKLGQILKETRGPLLIKEITNVLNQRGVLSVLRQGFELSGQKVRLVFFAPAHDKSPAPLALYQHNRLAVVRQLRYDPKNENELDLVLCINGIPLVTCELKNAMTGQTVAHARAQYQHDRDPAAPLFAFKRRALVHFAVDTDEAWMTTRLEGTATRFLPFNRGSGGGKGNPAVAGKHRTHYLWESVWAKDSLLDLVQRFLHLERTEGTDASGKKWVKEAMIFPRYHQLDCVRRLEAAARANGAGHNYLVQHSAGSGKSNSIAWLAHRLANLHDAHGQRVYHSVVVLTDRKVLDQQLQNTIYQFDHQLGVVEKVDKHSDQLAAALQGGAPIIVSTIHKFGFIEEKVGQLPDRRYALIVDEAHSSQSGEMAVGVKALLADSQLEEKLAHEVDDETTAPDQAALRKALERGRQPNLSFFAFTATPKYKTLELFGHTQGGKPAPFHLYPMRQAIEEGFILDVLQGYLTYERFFTLAKAVVHDPQVDHKKAALALARYVNLHPTNIGQKTAIIIEHFRSTVQHLLGGKAKAIVVTASRLQAVKYKLSFDGYLQEKGYADIRCLVAFSGEVSDGTTTWSEVQMNGGISESELPHQFATDAWQVLLVANKYQTGFDQPLLSAMYVDKRLAGVQAVQTLSRLNRVAPGKERTFVLDFVNRHEDIQAAFQPYYEATTVAEQVDPQRMYELAHGLREAQVFTQSEVDGFAMVFYGLGAEVKAKAHAQLNAWLDPTVDRFKALDAEAREAFRGKLVAFKNLYGFLSQVVPFADAGLEKLYAFGRLLLNKLPGVEGPGPLDLANEVVLVAYTLQAGAAQDLALAKGQPGELVGPTATGTGAAQGKVLKLSTIIQALNDRFGLNLPTHINDFVAGLVDALAAAPEVQLRAQANDKAGFALTFQPALEDTMAEHLADHTDFVTLYFGDAQVRSFVEKHLLDEVYGRIRGPKASPPSPGRVRLPIEQVRPFANAVPVYDLKVAAGRFSAPQVVHEVPQHAEVVHPEDFEWVVPGTVTPRPGLFVAQVVGESMNRRIPDGAWCVWRLHPGGDLEGKVVLAQHTDLQDSDLGQFTVKLYSSEPGTDGTRRVVLRPSSTDGQFEPITLEGVEGDLVIVAELVEVLG